MPLEVYQRGRVWWVKGRVEYNGRPITDYYRCSTGASSKQGATDYAREETERKIRRYLLGDEAGLTFNDAVMIYPSTPTSAKQLIPIVGEIGHMSLGTIIRRRIQEL